MGNNYLFFKVNFSKIDGDVICGLIVNIRRKYKGVDFGWGRPTKSLETDPKILSFLQYIWWNYTFITGKLPCR